MKRAVLVMEVVMAIAATGGLVDVSFGLEDKHHTLVIIGRFAGAHQIPCTQEWGQTVVFDGFESVAAFYRTQSYEQFTLGGRVVGPYMLSGPGTQCEPEEWKQQAIDAAAQDPGVIADGGVAAYDSITFNFPQIEGTDCYGSTSDGGEAEIYGPCYEDPIAREIGHNLGLGYSRAAPGPPGSIYGDHSTTMGDVTGISMLKDFVAPHKIQLGWIPDGPAPEPDRVREVTDSGLYSISLLEHLFPNTSQVLKLDELLPGEDAYYISYRTPYGVFGENVPDAYKPKMNIHQWEAVGKPTWFLGSDANNTQAFVDGVTWTDPAHQVCVTMVSHTFTMAHIWVSFGCEKPAPEACPEVTPCNGNSCLKGVRLGDENLNVKECVTTEGSLFECGSGQEVLVATYRCNRAPCCGPPPTCHGCSVTCVPGTYLECN